MNSEMKDAINAIAADKGMKPDVLYAVLADALESAPVIGVPLQEAKLPRGVLVGALLRDNQVIIPRGQTMIQKGDRVIIFSPKESIKAVEKLFSVAFGYF